MEIPEEQYKFTDDERLMLKYLMTKQKERNELCREYAQTSVPQDFELYGVNIPISTASEMFYLHLEQIAQDFNSSIDKVKDILKSLEYLQQVKEVEYFPDEGKGLAYCQLLEIEFRDKNFKKGYYSDGVVLWINPLHYDIINDIINGEYENIVKKDKKI